MVYFVLPFLTSPVLKPRRSHLIHLLIPKAPSTMPPDVVGA